jgi:hypothetical protein
MFSSPTRLRDQLLRQKASSFNQSMGCCGARSNQASPHSNLSV